MQDEKTRVLYIVGDGHSGSTLLDLVVGAHDLATSTGELVRLSIDPTTRICSCGATVENCMFWTGVLNELRHRTGTDLPGWASFPVSPGEEGFSPGRQIAQSFLWLGSQRALSLLARLNRSAFAQLTAARRSWMVFDAVAAADQSRVVVDSSKTPGRMRALYIERPASTYVLHLVRDGRAVVASNIRRTGATVTSATQSWRKANLKTRLMLRNVRPENRLLVRYEDFCASPLVTINLIYEFLGLPLIDEVRMPATGSYHLMPGNPILMTKISDVRLDERWKEELRPSALREFDRKAGRLNRSFGYA